MNTTDRFVSLDIESNGLAGQAFALGMTLVQGGQEMASAVYRCFDPDPIDPWVAANVLPAIGDIEVNCADYAGMIVNFRELHFQWTEEGVPTIAHVAWPVEARFLLDAFQGEDIWHGPYPLIDVSGVLLAKGHNPLSVDDYLAAHGLPKPDGSPHHPLYDARAAATCFWHLTRSS